MGILRQAQDGEHRRTISPWMPRTILYGTGPAPTGAGKAKNFSLRRDFAPDEAWGEVFDPECSDRRDTPSVSSRELHNISNSILGNTNTIILENSST